MPWVLLLPSCGQVGGSSRLLLSTSASSMGLRDWRRRVTSSTPSRSSGGSERLLAKVLGGEGRGSTEVVRSMGQGRGLVAEVGREVRGRGVGLGLE